MSSYDPFGGYDSGVSEKLEAKKNEVPSGTSKEILSWVGDDKDRAKRALDAENKKEKPRSSLVEKLEDVGK